jgi:hypothetical protein
MNTGTRKLKTASTPLRHAATRVPVFTASVFSQSTICHNNPEDVI